MPGFRKKKNKKPQFYNENQVKNMNGVVLGNPDEGKLNPNDLPDPSLILEQVEKLLERISEDEMIALEKEDNEKYIEKLEEEFSEFCKKYYSLFLTVISREDLTNLTQMLEQINNIKNNGKTYEEAEKELGEDLGSQYIKDKK